MSLLVVTGTDTGVGKTFVSAAIAAALVARGVRVAVAKPAETGCRAENGQLYPEDAATLAAASCDTTPLDVICPYRLPDPLAPALAAERAGVCIGVDELVAGLRARAAAADILLLEGAGGLLVPLTHAFNYVDLAAALAAPVLLVVGSRLGAINHALLTLEALAARRLAITGYVINRLTPGPDLAVDTNGGLLRTLTPVPCLGELPWTAAAPSLAAELRAGGARAGAARARLVEIAAGLDLRRISPGS